MNYAQGAITWSAASIIGTTYTVSGLPFQPKGLRFEMMGLGSTTDFAAAVTSRRSLGFATGPSARGCVASKELHNQGSMYCSTVALSTAIACDCTETTTSGRLDLDSITSDGFVLIVDERLVADNARVLWRAWGGTDITATFGTIAEPAGTGNQDYTVTGFTSDGTDQVVMFAGSNNDGLDATSARNDSGFYVSFGLSGSSVYVCGNQDDGSSNADTDGSSYTGSVVKLIVRGGGTTFGATATLTAWLTNGFRLNWGTVAVTNRASIFLAIKGGGWAVGSLTIDGSTLNATAAVSGLSFAPLGVLCIGRMATGSASSVTEDRMSWGAGTSTSDRHAMGHWSVTGGGSSVVELTIQYDQVLAYSASSALVTAYDISAMASDGFTLINDLAGGVASEWIGYLTFGSTEEATVQAGTDTVRLVVTETTAFRAVLKTPEAAIVTPVETGTKSQTGGPETKSGTETARVQPLETTRLTARQRGMDVGVVVTSETGRPRATFRATDTAALATPEGMPRLTALLRIAESLRLVITDLANARAVVRAAEAVGLTLADLTRLAALLRVTDLAMLRAMDVGSQRTVFQAADRAGVTMMETTVLQQAVRQLGTAAAVFVALDLGRLTAALRMAETARLTLIETARATARTAGLDVTRAVLVEIATLRATLRGMDVTGLIAAETPREQTALRIAESLTLTPLDVAQMRAVTKTLDTLRLTWTEAARIAQVVAAQDAVVLRAIETGVVSQSVRAAGSDSLGITATEVTRLVAAARGLEAVGITVTDVARLVARLLGTDLERLTVTETTRLAQRLAGAETLRLTLSETARTSAILRVSETIRVAGQDAGALRAFLRATETLQIRLLDQGTLILHGVLLTALETLPLTLTDRAILRAVARAVEQLPLGQMEVATLRAVLKPLDPLRVLIADQARLRLVRPETARLTATEAARLRVGLLASEGLTVALLDAATLGVRLQVLDPVVLRVFETAAVDRGLPFDRLAFALSDQGTLAATLADRETLLLRTLEVATRRISGIIILPMPPSPQTVRLRTPTLSLRWRGAETLAASRTRPTTLRPR